MKFFIVRHGDKEDGDFYNIALRHQDPPLSEEGIQKAKRLAEYFRYRPIMSVITSEYLRTIQTAQYIVRDKNTRVYKDKRLNEIDNGIIESLCEEEIKEKYPEFWSDFSKGEKDVRFPGGETGEEVKARQKHLIEELITNDGDILLVSHEGYMRLLMCTLLDIPVYRRKLFKVDMCGIIEIEFDRVRNEWRIDKFNYTLGT